MNMDEPLRPKNPRSNRSGRPRTGLHAVPSGQRSNGFLWCRVCQRSWAFNGTTDPESWPTHRCGRDIRKFDQFTLEDPNHTALPVWKQEAKR
jgi:hypothetical protein